MVLVEYFDTTVWAHGQTWLDIPEMRARTEHRKVLELMYNVNPFMETSAGKAGQPSGPKQIHKSAVCLRESPMKVEPNYP